MSPVLGAEQTVKELSINSRLSREGQERKRHQDSVALEMHNAHVTGFGGGCFQGSLCSSLYDSEIVGPEHLPACTALR